MSTPGYENMRKKYRLSESERKARRKYERKRRKNIRLSGMKEIRVVVHPEDVEIIKRLARRLHDERQEANDA